MAHKRTFDEFVEKSREVHGDKYDYIKNDFDVSNYVTYICKMCGKETRQRKSDHLYGKGCYKCRKTKAILTLDEWKARANEKHSNKYDYSLVNSHNRGKEKVNIICHCKDRYGNEHGVFSVLSESHIYDGIGCPKCAQEKRGFKPIITKELFISRAEKLHQNKYVYDENLEFINSRSNVNILCPKHGYFTQNAHAHLMGQGCPRCKNSKLENSILQLLYENNIKAINHYSSEWLGRQHLDFYLPEYNIAIECQGEQHFKPVLFNGDKETAINNFYKIQVLDSEKADKCKENGINLLYFAKEKYNDNIISSENELLEEIRKTKLC